MEVSTENTSKRWLSIVGIGQDGADGLSPLAQSLVSSAELVVGGARHLELAARAHQGRAAARGRPRCTTPFRRSSPGAVAPWPCSRAAIRFHFGVGKQIAALVPADELICSPAAFILQPRREQAPLGPAGHGDRCSAWPRHRGPHSSSSAGRAHPRSVLGWIDARQSRKAPDRARFWRVFACGA